MYWMIGLKKPVLTLDLDGNYRRCRTKRQFATTAKQQLCSRSERSAKPQVRGHPRRTPPTPCKTVG
jgi:hypothetical protein